VFQYGVEMNMKHIFNLVFSALGVLGTVSEGSKISFHFHVCFINKRCSKIDK
jgi:hypothetical protein